MLSVVLPLLFQAAADLPAVEQDGAAAAREPEVVCKMQPVTGSRAKRQKICKTKGYEQNSEQMRDQLRGMQNAPGAPAPGAPG